MAEKSYKMSLEPSEDQIEEMARGFERWKQRCSSENLDGARKLASCFVEFGIIAPQEEAKLTECLKELGLTYELAKSVDSGPKSFDSIIDSLCRVGMLEDAGQIEQDIKFAYFQKLVLIGFSLDPIDEFLDNLIRSENFYFIRDGHASTKE